MKVIRILKAFIPPIFDKVWRKFRYESPDDLFDGDDALFKKEIFKNVDVYGEYGCGKSTNWVLNNSKCKVISVDTSDLWIDIIKRDNHNNLRLNIHHSNLGLVGKWGRPISYREFKNFSDYTDYIWKQTNKPNLVLIDGRFRVCCFLTSLKYADEGTRIIFDDYTNRPFYHEFVEKYVKRQEEHGRQCLFVVPPKSSLDISQLNKDIELFRYVMD